MNSLTLSGEELTPHTLYWASQAALDSKTRGALQVKMSPSAEQKIQRAQDFVSKLASGEKAVYGINTGFGKFAEIKISSNDLRELQRNIILSHACGVGAPLSRDLVLAMWIIRLNMSARGCSGVRLDTVHSICAAIEKGFLAQIPSRGSVGASGDLCPSAHAVAALLGEGKASFYNLEHNCIVVPASEGLKSLQLKTIVLGPKEGLSLINGTQLSAALATKLFVQTQALLKHANLACAMMIEATRASHSFLDERILRERRHPGVLYCGKEIERILGGPSEISLSHAHCNRVQDPYSLRCAPQVHGLVHDELQDAERILSLELNSSSDNPLLFAEEEVSLSGGNFHAMQMARLNDRLCSALTTLANISERRSFMALNTHSNGGLPMFLSRHSGLHSGLMMIQTTAAALVSEAKALSFPVSVDSIPTNADREDHVSMGPVAGLKALQVLELAQSVIAIELIIAAQALDFLAPLKANVTLQQVHQQIRSRILSLEHDRYLETDLAEMNALISSGALV